MKKTLAAICMTILCTAFTFAQSLGEDEKSAIRSFFKDGYYIECYSPSGDFRIIKKQSVVSIQDCKDSSILIVTNNGSHTINWKSIKNDSSSNLRIKEKNPEQESSQQVPLEGYSDGGKVLNIYTWNDEFKSLLEKFYPDYDPYTDKIGDVKVNWIIIPSYDYKYQEELDDALYNQSTTTFDDRVDLFLVEADYALKYTDSPYTLDIKADLGFTDENLSKQFQFTKDIGTADGKLKALSWQSYPGCLIYRRSIAKEVFGTDDPDEVQALLSDWDKFNKAAEMAKSKGYYMVSGPDDNYRVFSNNKKTPWVVGNEINIDDSIKEWISQQKKFTGRGYNNKAALWTDEQLFGFQKEGKVFCYFGPLWYIDFFIEPQSENTSGDWAVCKGPQGFYWGGSWICAATGTDNISLVKDIMEKLTTDDKVMEKIARELGDFTNNENVMTKIANDKRFEKAYLGGQNPFKIFFESAKSIDKLNITRYDLDFDNEIQTAMKDYFEGKINEKNAWKNFYDSIQGRHPDLIRRKD